jgi:hypothetical protein
MLFAPLTQIARWSGLDIIIDDNRLTTFATSHTRQPLCEMLTTGAKYKKRKYIKSKEVKNANKKFL